ncbi:head-tail adaptor Ad1 [Caulobacter phage CcrBL9]|uniref:Putative DnaT-like domain-containing protein n=1 Tax=Caulobacter phage CcrBL9 TaxID=2283270 RepID=A0A385EBL7_9CAUD|nr:head-tail adaptor Ad1 [Caulobacter phage CcrBL9]AXQ69183.1 hypothetical protein CcrBL9_gp159 [Caulobacter phage CcrBL9]
MSFTFVVETGQALPDANSYSNIEFADDYVEMDIHRSGEWLGLDEDVKERLLARASKMLDSRVKWKGKKYDRDSGLQWPRIDVLDEDGYPISDDEVPQIVREATVEYAKYFMDEDVVAGSTISNYREIQVDVIELKINNETNPALVPDVVKTMIENSGLGTVDDGTSTTNGRMGFKKIRRT